MASYRNFDRQYRLAAGQAGGTGFEIGETSKTQPVPLHVNFSLQKSDLETQNTGRVTVWNLNKSQLAVLNEKDCVVSLRAGYGNQLPLIFAGIVSYVCTSLDSADRKTEIEVIDNLVEVRDTYVTVSYNGTVNWKTIFDDVAAQMGVAISYSYNAEFVDIANGFSFVGLARDIMTKGCKCCNLSWSLQNGVMQVKRPGDVMSKEVFVLSPDTGLLGIPARVVLTQEDATATNQLGWDVEYFLNGAINIDDYVKLESETVTGFFRVYSLEISGDNISGDWICKARLLEVSG
ncbi:phage protein [Flintibacter porci]|uniref:phage protein n=1 Tax=Flintibacter porci TaxID=3342383 RepID=UPI003F8929B6